MKKRFVVASTFVLMMVFVLFEFSCVNGDVPGNGPVSGDKVAEAPSGGIAQNLSQFVAARVNGREITMESVTKEMDSMFMQRGIMGKPTAKETVQVRDDALDYLIFMELAIEYGEKIIKVSDDEIDITIKQLKAELGTEKAYNDYLRMNKHTEETLRKDIEKKYLTQKTLQQEVNSKVVLDEEDTRREYEAHPEKFTIPAGIEVETVNIYPVKGDWKEAADRANKIAAELKEVKSANDIKNPKGLRIDSMTISQEKHPELFSKVSGLEPSGVSSIYDVDDSYQVMRVIQKTPEQLIPFDRAKKWLQTKANTKKAKEWYEDLKKGAKIEILISTGKKDEKGTGGQGSE